MDSLITVVVALITVGSGYVLATVTHRRERAVARVERLRDAYASWFELLTTRLDAMKLEMLLGTGRGKSVTPVEKATEIRNRAVAAYERFRLEKWKVHLIETDAGMRANIRSWETTVEKWAERPLATAFESGAKSTDELEAALERGASSAFESIREAEQFVYKLAGEIAEHLERTELRESTHFALPNWLRSAIRPR